MHDAFSAARPLSAPRAMPVAPWGARPVNHRPGDPSRTFGDQQQQHRSRLSAVGPVAGTAGAGGGAGGGSSGGGSGGDGGGNWGHGSGRPQELAQVAAGAEERRVPKKAQKPILLTLASFAVTRKAYTQIIKQFMKQYEEDTGLQVRFRCAFAGSGTQARAVIDGLPADLVALALPLDVQKIEQAGLIDPGWQRRLPNNAVVCTSVVALVVRPGNPKNIQGWDDLIRDDVSVVTANPKTAGVARWNFLALWGHKGFSKGPEAAQKFITQVFERVAIQPRDAREASDVFSRQKVGDVLLTYENEVVLTNILKPHEQMPYVAPHHNVVIENPVAIVDRNVEKRPQEVRDAAEAFLRYLYSPEAQRAFLACGFRPVNKQVASESSLPHVNKAWRVENKIGDWDKVQARFFSEGQILDTIQREVGATKLRQRMEAAAEKKQQRRKA